MRLNKEVNNFYYLCIYMCTDIKIFNPWGVRAVPLKPVGSYFTEMKEIPLTQGQFALVDDEDYDFLNQWKWYARKGQYSYYATRTENNIMMHRVIMKTPHGLYVDHINGNGLDNRKSNLRNCTMGENNKNRRKHKQGVSIYKGVAVRPEYGYYIAYFRLNGKAKKIGYYRTEEDAARAYDEAAKVYYGDFANLNFKT